MSEAGGHFSQRFDLIFAGIPVLKIGTGHLKKGKNQKLEMFR
jgi:hypothetical protein